MKKTDEILRKVQGRFGQITKEKVFARLIVVMIWFIPSLVLISIYVTLSEGGRIWMAVLIGIAITAFLVIRFRKRKLKIPVKKPDEKYVAVDKPTTAEMPIAPITAEKQHRPTGPHAYPPINRSLPPKTLRLEEIEISPFARKRIAEECYMNVQYAAYEIRKPAKELFFQLRKRLRTIEEIGEEKDKSTGKVKTKTRTKREPPSTIYGELLFFLVALVVLLLPILMELTTPPDWMTRLYIPIKESQIGLQIILGLGVVLVLWSAFLVWRKWAYWRYWRQVLLPPNEQTGDQGSLIIVNKPPLLGGKVTLASLLRVNRCFISTAQTENDLKGLRSLFLRILGLRWMIVDIQGDQDKDVNLMGPFKLADAARASRIVNNLSSYTSPFERE